MRSRLAFVAAVGTALVGAAALGREMLIHGTTPVFAAVRFEVRLAEETPIPGLFATQVPDSGRTIYLHPDVVVSNEDIADTSVSEDSSGRFGISVQLSPSGADRMRRATTSHIGRPLAILVEGRVVIAPVVRSAVGSSAVITGEYTRAEAERIAAGMRPR